MLPGEEICVWAQSNEEFFIVLWKKAYPDEPVPPVFAAAKKARRIANDFFHLSGRTPYELIRKLGETPPSPEHRAANDVDAMRLTFKLLKITATVIKQKEPSVPPPPEKKIDWVARNSDIVSRSSYNYIFIEGKDVFHRRTCRLFLTTRGVIQGAEYYNTACRGRRPCKICNPKPIPIEPFSTREKILRASQAKKKNTPAISPPEPSYPPVKMLDGSLQEINPKSIAGWCRFYKHPGAVTVAIINEHECLKKECPLLTKNDQCAYWKQREKKKEAKAETKLKKELNELSLQGRIAELQEYVDSIGYNMLIVRIADEEKPRTLRVYYVSPNTFPDGDRYPEFLSFLRTRYPCRGIRLQHIKDIKGHFVKINEYMTRKKK